ncbi:hypothetical protein MRX96_044732 [Rhipicephalus microplus]
MVSRHGRVFSIKSHERILCRGRGSGRGFDMAESPPPSQDVFVYTDCLSLLHAISSVSEATAVTTGSRGDPGTRIQARERELQDEICRFCTDSANHITVSARNYIMPRVFEMVNLCSDMRADAARERGADWCCWAT